MPRMLLPWTGAATFVLAVAAALTVSAEYLQGPVFINEPPGTVDFSNNTGAPIGCSARGSPLPSVRWTLGDGSSVTDVPRIRRLLGNGTLFFPPFRAEEYRQDVHAAVYKCVADNALGAVVSRDVWVRAVVMQVYEVQVYDEFVITGNTGVLRCHIPSFVTDYVAVTSWFQEGLYGIASGASIENGPKFTILPTGELHIKEVTMNDGLTSFRCRTYHRLTKETRSSSTSGRLIVTAPQGSVPPRITDARLSLQVRQGEPALLPCAAQGHPPPSYSWFWREKDGRLTTVRDSGRLKSLGGSLLIQGSQIADSGTYTCVVNNSIGSEKSETALTVTAPLSARVEPGQQVVDLGRSANLRCITSGFPVSSITWLVNGSPVDPDRVRLLSPEVIQIVALRREDMGMYQCMVKNSAQTVHGSAEVRIGDASPEFRKTFTGETVHPGVVVALVCVATGNPQPSIAWTLDGLQIPRNDRFVRGELASDKGDVIGYLNISNVQTEDGGEYRCMATNSVGNIEHSDRVNVYGPPAIRPTRRISALAGGDTVIRCPFIGYPIDSITWEKDSLKLPVNRRQRVYPNGTLEIQNVQSELDAGKYTCVVRSPQGQNARRDLEMIVVVPPGIAPFSFQGEQFVEGMRTRATCYVSKGDLPISITWLKDGRPLSTQGGLNVRVIDEYSSILTIDSVSPAHSGNYTCVARNSAAVANYTSRLIVNVPPRWLVEPQDQSILIGRRVVLDCRADGSPTPTITWMKAEGSIPGDYREIPSGDSRIQLAPNGSLVLTNAAESDDGDYMCQAANGVTAGLSRVVRLDVNVPPYFEVKSRNYTVKRGDDARLLCEARGDLPIKITWYMNGNKLLRLQESGVRYMVSERRTGVGVLSELVVRRPERQDMATFSCLANNSFGNGETLLFLIVQQTPESPKTPKVVDVKSRSVQLSWIAPYDGNNPILRYVIQSKDITGSWESASPGLSVPAEDTSATIFSLQPDHSYHMRIAAENGVGQGPFSDVVTITTEEEAPGGPPRHVQVSATDSQTLKVTWAPPTKDVWFGDVLGYKIGFKAINSTQPFVYRTMEVYNTNEAAYQFLVTGLKKYTRYIIVVQAYNRHGNGPNSEEVVAQTHEDVPSSPPQNIACVALSAQSLKLTWERPPAPDTNGILQGYKIMYKPINNWYGAAPTKSKSIADTSLTLFGLETYANYSVQLLAFTRPGDGAKSEPIVCATHEDVPDAPADIKAVTSSADSIVVSWKPPARSKGDILRYTVYVRALDGTKEETTKHAVAPTQLSMVAKGLRKNRRHEFWVTASTAVGEGQSTRVIAQSPSSKVAAKISSFDDIVVSRWKTNVSLPCRTVGHPTPEVEWSLRDQAIGKVDRIRTLEDGSLWIGEVLSLDAGNYTCKVRNAYGTDAVTYNLMIQAPPSPPSITVSATGLTSIHLQWEDITDTATPILGYSLSFRREYGEWEELQLETDHKSFILDNLWCGTRYQLYMTAYSTVGPGKPSDIITVKTKGSVPSAPSKDDVILENVTSVTLRLEGWDGDGCAILYFVVEYKPKSQTDWVLVSNHVKPQQERFLIGDLLPNTVYGLKITAHNNAGSTTAEYECSTRNTIMEGASQPGLVVTQEARGVPFYANVIVVVPVAVAIVVLVVAIATRCLIIFKRKRNSAHRNDRETVKTNPKYALVLERGLMNDTKPQLNNTIHVVDPLEAARRGAASGMYPCPDNLPEDVCPYATFQLSGFSRERGEDASNQTQVERRHSGTSLRLMVVRRTPK